jgi:hypothetical protein
MNKASRSGILSSVCYYDSFNAAPKHKGKAIKIIVLQIVIGTNDHARRVLLILLNSGMMSRKSKLIAFNKIANEDAVPYHC